MLDDRKQTAPGLSSARSDGVYPRAVFVLPATEVASQAKAHQLLHDTIGESLVTAEQCRQTTSVRERSAISQLSACIDRHSVIVRAKRADGVVLLEREPRRIEELVTGETRRFRAMGFEFLPQRLRRSGVLVLVESGNVRWRRRRR